MPEYSTTEIAAKCRVSERTIQRWIKEKLLPAHEIMRNRYIVDDDNIERMKPRTIQAHRDVLEQRIDALEQQIAELKQAIEELRSGKGRVRRHSGDQPARRATAHEAKQEDEQETLASFAERHNIAKTTYKRAAEQIGAYKKQNIWYLDEASKRAFYAKFHDSKSFKPCPDCPH